MADSASVPELPRTSLRVNAYVYGNPLSHTDPLGLFDAFGFGSLTAETPGILRAAEEGVALVGYNSDEGGTYIGDIIAGGAEVGSASNYVAGLVGFEATRPLFHSSSCPNSQNPSVQSISIKEGAAGPEVFWSGFGFGVGSYNTDTDQGYFFFFQGTLFGEHASIGFGGHL